MVSLPYVELYRYISNRLTELRNHDQYPEDGDEFQEEAGPDQQGTPRAPRRQSSRASNLNHNNGNRSSAPLAVPRRSDSAAAGSVTPTALASSLVSTVRAAASSPHPNSAENANSGLNDNDERLLEHLFESLGNVCMELQTITTSAGSDPKTVRVLRRRLDAARRVLDGELDT